MNTTHRNIWLQHAATHTHSSQPSSVSTNNIWLQRTATHTHSSRPSSVCTNHCGISVYMSHVPHADKSCHTYENVTSHICMDPVTIHTSVYLFVWVMSHMRMSHVTHRHTSCHTYERILSPYTPMCTCVCLHESRYTCQYVPHIWTQTNPLKYKGSFTWVTWRIHTLHQSRYTCQCPSHMNTNKFP